MKKLAKFALLGFVAWLFSACGSTQYAVTYATSPSGANVVCNGVGRGFTPLTLYYDKSGINTDGLLYTAPCKAIYASGYVDYFSNEWNTKAFPQGVKQTLTRPQGEGYAQDMAFSMEYERTRAMQRQAAAAQAQAQAAQQQAQAAQQQTTMQMLSQPSALDRTIQQGNEMLKNQSLDGINKSLKSIDRTLKGQPNYGLGGLQ